MKRARLWVPIVLLLVLLASGNPAAVENREPQAFNRIVVVLDFSGSFAKRFNEALAQVQGYLDAVASRRDRRWHLPDEVYIIALDSAPQVIWHGKRAQVRELKADTLITLAAQRRHLAECTDLSNALDLAVWKLHRPPVPLGKHLLVFSDLVDDPPPRKPGTGRCQGGIRPSPPPENFDWNAFKDVKILGFWAHDDEIRLWQPVLDNAGVAARLWDEAEARNAELTPPERPVAVASPEEDARKLRSAWMFGKYLVWGLGGLVALLLLPLGGAWIMKGTRSRRQRTGGNSPASRVPRN